MSTEKVDIRYEERILLVENDHLNINVISKYIEGSYPFDVALNADEAEKLLEANKYQLVLLDIHLGDGVGGLGILKYIRASEKLKDLLVVAMTAFAAREQRDDFINAGCDDYISKPFYKRDLLEIIKTNLENLK